MLFAILAGWAACGIASAQEATRTVGAEAPYVVLISIDGFRHDYLDRYPSPALARIARDGIRAKSLRPVWPTLTFPNHYSIATGLYPAEHGIIGNRFPAADGNGWYNYRDRASVQDGRWYGGEPLWVAAERAGLGSAAFYFVGTEAAVGGVAPADWRPFDANVAGSERVDQALAWLRRPIASRPHLVTLYFEQVDVASHKYGPGTPQVAAAIQTVDGWIAQLLDGLQQLPIAAKVHVAVVSDHGQAHTRRDAEPLVLEEHVDLEGVSVVAHGSVAMLYTADDEPTRARELRAAINRVWRHGRAWLPAEAPRYWQVANGEGIADVLLQPDPGHVVLVTRDKAAQLTTGNHGWSPGYKDMHGIFIASGPKLPASIVTETIDAVAIYPLLMAILGLPDHRADPHPSPLPELLKDQ